MNGNFGEVITAMATPFKEDLTIDFKALEKLTEHLIKNGSDTLLVAGTTGECPTLTHEEEHEIFKCVQSVSNKRAKVILGAGSNSTLTAVEATKNAEKLGADGVLTVVPYYNKPTQKGMISHFSAIASSTGLPLIIYNIPSRTGVNMQPKTAAELANKFENIVALKQSNPDLDLISEVKTLCPKDFVIYSGDDSLTLPMISLGVDGVISVASHLFGTQIKTMIEKFKKGDVKTALDIHLKLFPIFKKIFFVTSPVPIKQLLADISVMENYVRQPLVLLDEKEKAELREVYQSVLKSV